DLGKLDTSNGKPFQETDLWALQASGDQILFTAGLANEAHGLFGSLSATSAPDPSMTTLTGEQSGLGGRSDTATGATMTQSGRGWSYQPVGLSFAIGGRAGFSLCGGGGRPSGLGGRSN